LKNDFVFGRKITAEETMKDRELLVQLEQNEIDRTNQRIQERELALAEKKSLSGSAFLDILTNLRKSKTNLEKAEPFTSDFDFLYETTPQLKETHKYLEDSIQKIENLIKEI